MIGCRGAVADSSGIVGGVEHPARNPARAAAKEINFLLFNTPAL
jgi:hypothetical protein